MLVMRRMMEGKNRNGQRIICGLCWIGPHSKFEHFSIHIILLNDFTWATFTQVMQFYPISRFFNKTIIYTQMNSKVGFGGVSLATNFWSSLAPCYSAMVARS